MEKIYANNFIKGCDCIIKTEEGPLVGRIDIVKGENITVIFNDDEKESYHYSKIELLLTIDQRMMIDLNIKLNEIINKIS